MRFRRILSLLVAMAMLFSCVGITAMAEETGVAKIGDTYYATFDEALTAANAMTGEVTIEIYGKVTLNKSLAGSYNSITFVGKADAAEIYLEVEGYITATGKDVAFKDLKLSKSEGGFITNAGFMNVAFGIYDVKSVSYTDCTFENGAYASSGKNTFTGCTFYRSHDKYGLWAYGDVEAIVEDCKFDDYRGIKMYAEGAAKTVDLTVKNTDFSAVDNKPAIVLTYGESVTLEGNTYSDTGVFELDLAGAPNGTSVTSDVAPTCKNDNGACGVLVDGKIYTTVAQAAEVATEGSTVTLLHDSTETVVLPEGVTFKTNGYTADGVTVKVTAPVEVDTYEELAAALAQGGNIILTADITTTSALTTSGITATIDLNGKTLSVRAGDNKFNDESNITIKNGNIDIDDVIVKGNAIFCLDEYEKTLVTTLTLEDVNLTGENYSSAYGIFYIGKSSILNVNGGVWNLSNDTHASGGVFKADASSATLNITGTEMILHNVRRVVTYADTTITDCTLTISGDADEVDAEMEHGFNRSPLVIDNSTITMKNMVGRGITAQNGAVEIKNNSTVTMENVQEATIDVRSGQTVTISENSTVTVDVAPTITSGTISGVVTVPPTGTVTPAYTKEVDSYVHVWGEGGANAKESFVLELFYGDTKIATTRLNNVGGIIDGDVYVTWNFFYPESNDEYWTTTWEEGHPNSAAQPDKVVLYADGVKVAENVAKMNAPDDLAPVVWEELGGVKYVVTGLSGSGTEEDPYLINNLDDLKWFRDNVNTYTSDRSNQYVGKYVKLTSDIDLDEDGDGLGELWTPIGQNSQNDHVAFLGIFDGDGHTISNLYVDSTQKNAGFFASTGSYIETEKAIVKNITFKNVYVHSTSSHVGGVIGNSGGNTSIENLHVTGTIDIKANGGYVGGIVGHGYPVINNSSVVAEGVIDTAFWCAGGMVGYAGEGSTNVKNSKVEGTGETGIVIRSAAGAIGAIVGMASDNEETQPISGSNLLARNISLQTYIGAYGDSYSDYAVGYLYGGSEITKFTGTNIIENVTFLTSKGETNPPVVDAVAKVGNNIYLSLEDAFAAANTGDTVTLLSDVEMTDSVVISSKALTLDLGEYTIYDKNTTVLTSKDNIWGLIALKNSAKLTVCGNGKIECNYAVTTDGWTGMVYAFDVDATSELTVNSGYFTNGNGVIQTLGTVTVNNGTFVSHNGGTCIMAVNSTANVTVNDGVFKDSVGDNDVNTGSGAVWAGFGATVNINGGTYDFAPDPSNENVVWTLFPAQNAIAGHGENAKMIVRGGTFVNFNPSTDVIVGYSQSEGFTFGSVVAEGYAALADLKGNYVVGETPTATVKNLGAMTISAGDYISYPSGDTSADMPLNFVMQFVADQDADDMATSPFADWYADFVITFEGIKNDSFDPTGCYLAGYYGSTDRWDGMWVKIPVDGLLDSIDEDTRYPVMMGVEMPQSYEYICSGVQAFSCAMFIPEEILAENPDLKVNLELNVVDSSNDALALEALQTGKNIYKASETAYTAEDFKSYVAQIGEVKYTTLAQALDAAKAGDTVTIFAGDYTGGLSVEKEITVVGETDAEGNNLVNISGKLSITADGATVKNININNGNSTAGYISAKDVTVEGCSVVGGNGFRYCYTSGTVTFKDSVITGSTYGIHFDGNDGGNIVIDNCTITGWTSFAGTIEKVTISRTEFAEGNYNQLRFYQDAEITDSEFNPDMTVDFGKNNVELKITDCTVTDNSPITDIIYLGDIATMGIDVTINGESVVVEASVLDDGETKVKYYLTLEEAIAAAKSATVTLLSNVELTNTIAVSADKTITLDLAGNTITYNSTVQGEAMITNKGTLTINDSSESDTGVINYNYNGAADSSYGKGNYTISNAGTLTVNGGKITIANLRGHAKYPIDNNSTTGDAILVINGGHLYNYNTSAIRQFCNSTTYKNSVTITGGKVEGYCAIWVQNPGSKTVNGSLSITGGEIKSTAAAYVNGSSALKDVPSHIYCTIDGEGGAWDNTSAIRITGGTINENIDLATEAPEALTVNQTTATCNGRVELPEIPVELFELRGANVKLGSDLTMFFYIPKAELESGVDYYATITKANAGEEATVVNVQMSEWESYNDGLYRVAFDDIMAYMMNDKIEVQIFDADGTAVSDIWTDSISIYAHRIYANQNDKYKTALVDMLNYGAACQNYFEYDAENLANKDLTDEQKNMASVDPSLTDSRVEGDNYYGSSLTCDSTLILQFYFKNIDETMTAKITYTDAYGDKITETIDGSKFNKRTATLTGVKVGLAAYDAQQLVKCEVYDGDTLVASATDSVESYVARMTSTNDVYATIMKFALSSKSALIQ